MSLRCYPAVHGIVLAGVHSWGGSALERIGCPSLLPIAGRPLISYLLDWFCRAEVRNVSVCANGSTAILSGIVERWAGRDCRLDFYEDPMPRGPAGCIRDAATGSDADFFVVSEGRLLPNLDVLELLEEHLRSGADLTVLASSVGPIQSGIRRTLEPLGIYVVSRSALSHVPERGYQDIKEVWIPRLHEQGQSVAAHVVEGDAVCRVWNTEGYFAAHDRVVEQVLAAATWTGDYRRVGSACVHVTSRIESSAVFSGPVLIGPECRVGAFARIIGPTTIGAGSVVDQECVISRSVLWSRCRVGARAIMDRCTLTLGAVADPELVLRDTLVGTGSTAPNLASAEPDLYWPAPCRLLIVPRKQRGSITDRKLHISARSLKVVGPSRRIADRGLAPAATSLQVRQ